MAGKKNESTKGEKDSFAPVEKDSKIKDKTQTEDSSVVISKVIKLLKKAFSDSKQFNKYISKTKVKTDDGGYLEEVAETELNAINTERLLDAIKIFEAVIKINQAIGNAPDDAERSGVVILPQIMTDEGE